MLSGLDPSTEYHIVLYAENGVSDISGQISSAEITVTTDASGKRACKLVYQFSSVRVHIQSKLL